MSLAFRLYAALVALVTCALAGTALAVYPEAFLLLQKVGISPGTMGVALLLVTLCALCCVCWLVHLRVLRPLRHLHHELGGARQEDSQADEVRALVHRVRRLLEKVQRAEAQLEESHETLRHTEKLALVGKLAAGVAHSIRNPLTGIKLRLFSLTKALSLTAKQHEDLAAINDAVRHMEAITNNFLEFSRRPRLSKEPINLSQVVDNTLSLLQVRLESFQVRVDVHRADAMPLVDADAEQLREALANLIINACEAMGVGGVLTITEESGQLVPLGKVAVLRVADSGPGIPGEMQNAIFQPFVSTKAEGTGLGLPIAQKVFEEHGGWLHLHTAPGRGATFVAVLPARKDEDVWIRS